MSLRRKFLGNAIPTVVSMWMFSLYTIIDGIFVSAGVGPMALASVNLAMPFVNLILGASLLFSTGAAAYISIRMGKGDLAGARQAYMTVLVSLVVIAFTITGLTMVFLDPLVRFLGAPKSLAADTGTYLMTVVYFAVFQMLGYFFEVMSVADGFPKMATASVAIAGVVNIVLDYLFVIRFGWGVQGAAVATGIAQVVSLAFLVLHVCLAKNRSLVFSRFRFEPRILLKSIPLGIADSITEFSVGIVVFLFNHRILQMLGEEGLVSYTVIAYINTLVVMTMFGLSQGMLPLVGYHHGSREWDKVKRLLGLGVKGALGCSVGWFVICEAGAGVIVSLFIDAAKEPRLFLETVSAFRLYSLSFLFMGLNVILSTWFSAVERPRPGIAVSLGRALVMAGVMLYVASAILGPTGIWLSAALSEAVCLIAAGIFYFRFLQARDAAAAPVRMS